MAKHLWNNCAKNHKNNNNKHNIKIIKNSIQKIVLIDIIWSPSVDDCCGTKIIEKTHGQNIELKINIKNIQVVSQKFHTDLQDYIYYVEEKTLYFYSES